MGSNPIVVTFFVWAGGVRWPPRSAFRMVPGSIPGRPSGLKRLGVDSSVVERTIADAARGAEGGTLPPEQELFQRLR